MSVDTGPLIHELTYLPVLRWFPIPSVLSVLSYHMCTGSEGQSPLQGTAGEHLTSAR